MEKDPLWDVKWQAAVCRTHPTLHLLHIICLVQFHQQWNDQDVDLVNCSCSETYCIYYQTLVITFSIIWIICFCLITIWDLMRFFHIQPDGKCFGLEKVMGICFSSVDQIAAPRSRKPVLKLKIHQLLKCKKRKESILEDSPGLSP